MSNKDRVAAYMAGVKTYRTGKPCKRGHNSPRYASTGCCVECVKLPGKMAREIRAARSKGRMEFTCMIDIRDYDTLDAVAKSLQLARVKETGAPFEPEVKERRAIRAAKSHEIANARRDEILETARIARAIEPAHE